MFSHSRRRDGPAATAWHVDVSGGRGELGIDDPEARTPLFIELAHLSHHSSTGIDANLLAFHHGVGRVAAQLWGQAAFWLHRPRRNRRLSKYQSLGPDRKRCRSVASRSLDQRRRLVRGLRPSEAPRQQPKTTLTASDWPRIQFLQQDLPFANRNTGCLGQTLCPSCS